MAASAMLRRRGDLDAARRAQERRQRAERARKLTELVPELGSLRLEIDETLDGSSITGARHIRHIVVDHAPALFEIPCSAPDCRDGGHDLTDAVLGALQTGSTQFAGEDVCRGSVGTGDCGRVLHFVAHARYDRDTNPGEID
jgi:hypothetical protein